jgi:hypothetical protein
MKKIAATLFLGLMSLFAPEIILAWPGQAGNFYGNATTYRVTVSKVETSQDGVDWHTVGEGTQTFDIASVNVGAQVGNYMSGASIPAGTYRYMRITVSRTMLINGSGSTGGVPYYTTANTINVDGGTLGVGTANQAGQAQATILIPANAQSPVAGETIQVSGNNLIVTQTLNEPFTVTAGGGTLMVNFNTQRCLEFDPNENALPNPCFYPIPPTVSIEFR